MSKIMPYGFYTTIQNSVEMTPSPTEEWQALQAKYNGTAPCQVDRGQFLKVAGLAFFNA